MSGAPSHSGHEGGSRLSSPLLVECAVYLSFATPLAMFGAAWPEARHLFGQSAGALGVLVAVYGTCRLSTSASAMVILGRWHVRSATVALCLGLAAADLAAAWTRSFPVLVASMGVVGLASGSLDSLGSRYQSVVRDVGSAGLMFGCYGIGATLGPAIVVGTSWRVGFALAALLAAVAALAAVRPAVAWPSGLWIGTRRSGHGRVRAPLGPLLVSFAAFAVYPGIEAVVGNWGATYLDEFRGAAEAAAGLAVSGFWAGMTLGRLGLGRVPAPPRRILFGGGTAVLVVLALIPVVPVPVAGAAFVVLGLALAVMFPTLMSTTADRVGVLAAGRVTGWQLLAGNVAVTALSSAVGVLVAMTGAGAPVVVSIVLAVLGLPVLARATALHAADDAIAAEPST